MENFGWGVKDVPSLVSLENLQRSLSKFLFEAAGTGRKHGWRADWGEENRNLTKGILILFSNEIFILSDSVTIIKEHRRTFLRGDKGWWRGKIFPWVGKSSQGWENLPMSGKIFSTDYTENSTRMVAREKIFP